ncbi:muconolactone delta-isomerase [Lentzea aerocolonigenes]|uniref:Muconolactone delta-isomerase n=1 Tax=Lentzea aerocolonigenes TaxID=68170 RepID=A0A0F0GGL5_LENAE|nr:muconolactone Delta-isomerase family protein [Lentzea aerocolonigenes]KJK33276.1 muconolactone delta-isomerase [Lentzea aerocolonigenes]
MREFIVEITTTIPDGTSQSEVDSRRALEAVRAKELAASGNLVRLWRPIGEMRSIGLWQADDEDDLHANVLGTLPLSPWMAFNVTAVQPHPNDPGRS